MSAETLRRAAKEIRADFTGVNYAIQSDFMLAVAAWLEYIADAKATSTMPYDTATILHALAIARTYLGESA